MEETVQSNNSDERMKQIIEILRKDTRLLNIVFDLVTKEERSGLTVNSPSDEEMEAVYTVADVMRILKLKRSSAYQLVKEAAKAKKPFMVIHVNNSRYRISKESFDRWIREGGD